MEAATNIGDGLKQLATETADVPVGAIVLLSDGSQNTAGTGGSESALDALQALRNRRLPVHTVGFGKEEPAHDVEIEDVSVAASATANARIAATISLTQHGYAGQKAKLTVSDREKVARGARNHFADGWTRADRTTFLSHRRRRRKKPHVQCRAAARRRKPR